MDRKTYDRYIACGADEVDVDDEMDPDALGDALVDRVNRAVDAVVADEHPGLKPGTPEFERTAVALVEPMYNAAVHCIHVGGSNPRENLIGGCGGADAMDLAAIDIAVDLAEEGIAGLENG